MTGIIRLVILAALVWLAWRVLRQVLAPSRRPPPGDDDAARMLRCETCGVHVPETEAFVARGHAFCSQTHQQQWLEKHDH